MLLVIVEVGVVLVRLLRCYCCCWLARLAYAPRKKDTKPVLLLRFAVAVAAAVAAALMLPMMRLLLLWDRALFRFVGLSSCLGFRMVD